MTIAEIKEATQHLTFKLDEEVFALDISKVREVLEYTSVTKVPQNAGSCTTSEETETNA